MGRRATTLHDERRRQLDEGAFPPPETHDVTNHVLKFGRFHYLQQWLLDTPTAAPRLLKQRSGHHAPPHLVRYYGDDGKALLTAGKDHSLRYTSVVRDSRGYELSQGSIARRATRLDVKPSSLKLPLITSLAYSTSRSRDWDDVVTVSSEEARGRSWSVEGKRVGKYTFEATGKVTVSFSFLSRVVF